MAKYDHFLGVKNGLAIKEVTEPTDIIWENRSITNRTRVIRRCIVYLIIFGMLALSAYAIFSLSIASLTLKLKYPPKDCVSKRGFISNGYKGYVPEDVLESTDPHGESAWFDIIQKDAIEEVGHARTHMLEGKKESHPGYLQCYCDYVKKYKKDAKSTKLSVTYEKQEEKPEGWTEGTPLGVETITKDMDICWEYLKDSSMSKIMGQSVAFFIIAVNTILKMVTIKCI